MSYKSILVSLDVDAPIYNVIRTAIHIAGCHEAKLIGLCAADVALPLVGTEDPSLAIEVWQETRDDLSMRRFVQVRKEFDRLSAGFLRTEWRQGLVAATSAIVDAARVADLVIMAASDTAFPVDNYRHADSAGVVLRSGRPLLILGRTLEEIHFKKILIAWKDTREARRAVADAVPLLREANEVIVVAATSDIQQELHESTNDIKDFLVGHGVVARTEFIKTDDEVTSLLRFIDESRADLVVAGAYGHSRLREWAFGGVTRSLLKQQELNLLISS